MPAVSSNSALPWRPGKVAEQLPPTRVAEPTPGDEAGLGTAYPLGWVARPAEDVASSWLRQICVIDVEGVRIRMQACLAEQAFGGVVGDQSLPHESAAWPLATAVLIIGAVRGPSVIYEEEATAQRDELARQLALFGASATPVTTVDRAHRWTEPSVLAGPGDIDGERTVNWQIRALGIARRMGVSTVVRIVDGRWQVLSLVTDPSPRFVVTDTAGCSLTRDVEHRCPLQRTPEAGGYCQMRGGPWTSSSIHAAAGWRDHRDLLVRAVGCDTCEGTRYLFQGGVRTSGGPIAVVTAPIPTRWLAPTQTALGEGDDDAHA